tara:strand:+ start:45848 stop:46558 length:711 start_codon:yes stop_codon:yes gene_type:complete
MNKTVHKEIEMKFVLYGVALAGLSSVSVADLVEYNGVSYETINWSSVSSTSNSASGTAGGVGVTFETVDITTDSLVSNNYNGDSGFDALSFQNGVSDALTIMGGSIGQSMLTFDRAVSSVLVLIGSPNDTSSFTQLGAAIWTFDQGVEIALADSEGTPGLAVSAGNLLSNLIGPATHQSGVLMANGEFNSLAWDQSTSAGTDQTLITFAIVPATIPAPSTGLALLLPAAFAGRRRR